MDNNTNETRHSHNKKPWYNQGWMWLIVAAIGIGVLFFALSGLTDEVSHLNESIQDQTEAIEEQTRVSESIKESMDNLITTIQDAVNTLSGASS
ncbi:hypothetical protein JCM9140_3759 [Halalkalibacter wakoensis JCM 9140]|uniref:Uncharacterized protein n=1 Tax=Halalkalibacter wakoensis JCM 9140 TaxID=1236970 RepID=W4Q6A5_9BACI|nr:hypothetical protein [Halalkalibacter wakoensis]GAE27606.1 hypothetical protein JCM9140_3759 [Halalkalibacter wakoensis JCM 9140]